MFLFSLDFQMKDTTLILAKYADGVRTFHPMHFQPLPFQPLTISTYCIFNRSHLRPKLILGNGS